MQEKLQRLVDHFEIRELLEAYVHAQDHTDAEATIDIYHPDSWDDHGPLKDQGQTYAVRATEALLAHWRSCSHLLGQSRINVDGDLAGAETYFYCSMTRDEDGAPIVDQMAGRYLDHIERRDGEWRIKERRCIIDWSMSLPVTKDYVGADAFLKSHRSEEDLSYEVLGLKRGNSRIAR